MMWVGHADAVAAANADAEKLRLVDAPGGRSGRGLEPWLTGRFRQSAPAAAPRTVRLASGTFHRWGECRSRLVYATGQMDQCVLKCPQGQVRPHQMCGHTKLVARTSNRGRTSQPVRDSAIPNAPENIARGSSHSSRNIPGMPAKVSNTIHRPIEGSRQASAAAPAHVAHAIGRTGPGDKPIGRTSGAAASR